MCTTRPFPFMLTIFHISFETLVIVGDLFLCVFAVSVQFFDLFHCETFDSEYNFAHQKECFKSSFLLMKLCGNLQRTSSIDFNQTPVLLVLLLEWFDVIMQASLCFIEHVASFFEGDVIKAGMAMIGILTFVFIVSEYIVTSNNRTRELVEVQQSNAKHLGHELNQLKTQLGPTTKTCIICYKENSAGGFIFNCGHFSYCLKCMQRYLRKNDKCPECHQSINSIATLKFVMAV